jgi:lipoyl-dependent peroxiredoxin
MFREAHAIWKGGPYAGEGAVSTPSGVLSNATYTFGSLTGVGPFTTPCELLAAAIASCMSTMVALEMAKLGIKPAVVDTLAVLTLDNPADRWRITSAHLKITARTTDPESSRFEQAVESARRECPIWSTLKLNLTCEAKLISLTAPALV